MTREEVWRVVIGVRSRDDVRIAATLKDAILCCREKQMSQMLTTITYSMPMALTSSFPKSQNLGIGWRQMWSAAVLPAEPHADRRSRKRSPSEKRCSFQRFWTSSFSICWSSKRLSTMVPLYIGCLSRSTGQIMLAVQTFDPAALSPQVSRVIRSGVFTKSL